MESPPVKNDSLTVREAEAALIGTTIGDRFRVLNTISADYISDVYKACEVSSVKTVSLKIIHLGHAPDANALKLFEHNARLSIQHPNLVTMHACGLTDEGEPWVACEYLEGQTLDDLLKAEGCLSKESAISLFRQILSAVAHLHSKGEVHLNLKPANISIVEDAQGRQFAKISDFGVARLMLERELELADERAPAQGSPLYMSPEQLRGESVDTRTDVYSLGCMLFHCLIGRPPHEGLTLLETMDRHLHAEVQFPSEPETSDAMQALLRRAMAKELGDRYRTAGDLLADLDAAASGKSLASATPRELATPSSVTSYRAPQGMPRRGKKGNEPWMLLLTCVTLLLFVLIIQQCMQIVASMR